MRALVSDRLIDALGRGRRPADGIDATPAVTAPTAVDFVAYGEDCLIAGRLRYDGERLTDFLNEHEAYEVDDLIVEELIDGRTSAIAHLVVPRDELLVIQVSGPRGDLERRVRTQGYPVAAKVGPYRLRGRLHAPPGLDPTSVIARRSSMVPLTDTLIDRPVGPEREVHLIGTVVINRLWVDWLVETWDDSRHWLEIEPA